MSLFDQLGPSPSRQPTCGIVSVRAAQMSSQQRGPMVGGILAGLGPQVTSVVSSLGLNPSLAQNPASAPPADAGALAAHVQQERREIFNHAMAFFAQHPMLVKTLGEVAIARIAQQLTQR